MTNLSNRVKLIATLLILSAAFFVHDRQHISHKPGMTVSGLPRQASLNTPARSFKFHKFLITPLAEYEIQARVLSIHTYWWDDMSELSPIDFAVGWNKMSDSTYIDQLDISQGNRFYFYTWTGTAPMEPNEIISSSANMHLIPSDKIIFQGLKKIRVGDIVVLKGELIEAMNAEGMTVRSSLSRDDTGFGACEVMWVTSVSVQSQK